MKNLILSIFFVIISIFSYGQKNREFVSAPYLISIKTIDFIVLDINYDDNLVAFKHIIDPLKVYNERDEPYRVPCDCHYTGMEKHPYAGVILGVYDLSKGEYLKTFTIYNACYDSTECFDYELSAKKLDSAKTFFIEHNLDITKKPKPINFVQKDDTNELKLGKSTYTYDSENIYDDDDEDRMFLMRTVSKLYANQQVIYWINQEDYFYMASGGKITYICAYKEGNKVVFLNKFHHYNSMGGETDSEVFHFTPVFTID